MTSPIWLFFDLDETLYDETEFRISGHKAVSTWLDIHGILSREVSLTSLSTIVKDRGWAYGKIFDDLVRIHKLPESLVPTLVNVYRSHPPQINLYRDFVTFANSGRWEYTFGLITEGLGYIQRNKIKALGLSRWIDPSRWIITGELAPGSSKSQALPFTTAAILASGDGGRCVYVGDNPETDFDQPCRLGWVTLRLMRGMNSRKPGNAYIAETVKDFLSLEAVLRTL